MDHSKYVSILFVNANLIGDYIQKILIPSYSYMKFDEMEAKENIILLSVPLVIRKCNLI
jgi:hypothetical protein